MLKHFLSVLAGTTTLMSVCTAEAQEAGSSLTMDEIIVTTQRTETAPTEIAPDAAELLKTPGELSDPVKAISLLPSVTFAANDFEELVIRGAGPNDNLLLIDNIPFYQILHDLSDTIVSDWAVRTFEVHTGTAPANYGTGLGGVVNIKLRQPKSDGVSGVLDLSQLRSGIFLEGPVGEGTSGYISIRENLAHAFLKRFEGETDVVRERLPHSRDYNAKLMWESDSTAITFTSIGAYDKSKDEQLRTVNAPAGTYDYFESRRIIANAVEFRQSYSNDSELTLTGSLSQTKHKSAGYFQGEKTFDVNTLSLRSQYSAYVGYARAKFGLNYRSDEADSHSIYQSTETSASNKVQSMDGFFSIDYAATDRVFIEAGASVSYDEIFEAVHIGPRLSFEYTLNPTSTLFAKAGSVSQMPFLEEVFRLTPTAREALDKNTANEASFGYRITPNNNWRAQAEIYYKNLDVVEFSGGSDPTNFDGEVYGIDLLVSRSTDKGFFGFLSLTFSENTRSNPSGDLTYDYEFSFPVSATLSLNYAGGGLWRFGGKYRYQSGQVFSPASTYVDQRSEAYKRLDLRIERQTKLFGTDTNLFADAMNVLSADNRSNQSPDSNGRSGIPFVIALGARIGF